MQRSNASFASLASLTVLLVLAVSLPSVTLAADYNAQTVYTFVNRESEPAHGLVVVLSAPAQVVTTDTGSAGPFRNIRGNGTTQITLTNSAELIPVSGDGATFDMTFRTSKKKISVTKWWWTNAKGKPLGAKNKG